MNPSARLIDLAFRLRLAHDAAGACSRSLPPEWCATQDVVDRVVSMLGDCADAVTRECREAEDDSQRSRA